MGNVAAGLWLASSLLAVIWLIIDRLKRGWKRGTDGIH